jgi:hypothetical protein
MSEHIIDRCCCECCECFTGTKDDAYCPDCFDKRIGDMP